MDEFLATLYGTRETIGASAPDTSDLDKLAEAQILDSMFQSEGINVDELPDATILKIAQEIFGDDSALVKSAQMPPELKEKMEEKSEGAAHEKKETKEEEKGEEAEEKEASETFEEKFAQADKLGRVMAHAFVQERASIEKQASEQAPAEEQKIASAIDILAEQRALEMLKEAGIDPTQQPSAEEQKLAELVEKRAHEMLAQAGYIQE